MRKVAKLENGKDTKPLEITLVSAILLSSLIEPSMKRCALFPERVLVVVVVVVVVGASEVAGHTPGLR